MMWGIRQVTHAQVPDLGSGGGRQRGHSVLLGSPFCPYVGLSEKVSSALKSQSSAHQQPRQAWDSRRIIGPPSLCQTSEVGPEGSTAF